MKRRVSCLAGIGRWLGKPRGWERVVRWLAPPDRCGPLGESTVERDGFTFVVQPVTPVGWNVLLFGSYEPELRAIFRAAVPEGGVAVDVGANVGWHSLLMARLAGPSGRLVAVEPNPSVRAKLIDNLVANRLENVIVIPFAISAAEGWFRFHGPPAADGSSGSGHLLSRDALPTSASFDVETRRLDTVLAEAGVGRLDLMKIDVEGFEWPVLQGAENSIERFRPQVVFEYNEEYASRGGATPAIFEDFFRRHRYRLAVMGRSGARSLTAEAWPSSGDIWAVPL